MTQQPANDHSVTEYRLQHQDTMIAFFRLAGKYVLIGVPPLVLSWLVYRHTVNVPWFDDIESFPGFLLEYLKATTWSDRLYILTKHNNEHRIVPAKFLTLITYLATGNLNMRLLIFGGLFCLIGTWALFLYVFVKNRVPLHFAIPLSLLIFQPQFYLTTFWAITGLQHQPVIFFSFLSLYFLVDRTHRYRLIPALLLALIATFTNGNGMFIWFAGLGVLILQGRSTAALIWLLTAIAGMAAYFAGLTTQGNESGLTYAFAHPINTVLAFFTFIGGLLDFMPYAPLKTRVVLPIIAGFFIVVWILFWFSTLLLRIRPDKDGPAFNWRTLRAWLPTISDAEMFWVGCMLYLFTTAVIIAVFRLRFGFNVMIISNYKIYPTLFLTLAYCMYVFSPFRIRAGQYRVFTLFVAVCSGISLLSYWHYTPLIIERRKVLLAQAINQKYNDFGLGASPGTPFAQYAADIMHQAIRKNIYAYPQDSFSARLDSALVIAAGRNRSQTPIPVEMTTNSEFFLVDNQTMEFPTALDWSRGTAHFLRVYSPKLNLLFKADPNLKSGLNIFRVHAVGFNVAIPRSALFGEDSCTVELVTLTDQTFKTYPIRQKIKPDVQRPNALSLSN